MERKSLYNIIRNFLFFFMIFLEKIVCVDAIRAKKRKFILNYRLFIDRLSY